MTAFDTHRPPQLELHRRLRPLRVLPGHLPDVRAVGRRGRLAARADRADRRGPEGRRTDVRRDGHPLRPLPGLHGVRDRLPVGRPVRPSDRAGPPAGRAPPRAFARPRRACAGCCSRRSPTPSGCGRWRRCWPPARKLGADRLPGRMAMLAKVAPADDRAAAARQAPRAHPGGRRAARPRGAAAGLRAAGLLSPRSTGPRSVCWPPRGSRCSRPQSPDCCGALQLHSGEEEAAVARARRHDRGVRRRWASSTTSSPTPPAAARR